MDISNLFKGLTDKLQGWLETFVAMLPNVAVAILAVFAFALAARWISRALSKGLGRFIDAPPIVNLLSKMAYVAVLSAGLFAALGILDLDKTVTSLLAGVGILGLALGFAFQDIAANFVAGVLLAIRRPFEVGDLVEVAGSFGRVKTIDLRATRLTQLSGETVIIPNKDVFQSAIVNYTDTKSRRVDIEVGVSYADDLRRVEEVAAKAVSEIDPRDSSRDVEVFFTGFGDSSINLVVRVWIQQADQLAYLRTRSQAIVAIKSAFDAAEISIPFPIRTLDFGIAGGEALRDHLRDTAAAAE